MSNVIQFPKQDSNIKIEERVSAALGTIHAIKNIQIDVMLDLVNPITMAVMGHLAQNYPYVDNDDKHIAAEFVRDSILAIIQWPVADMLDEDDQSPLLDIYYEYKEQSKE